MPVETNPSIEHKKTPFGWSNELWDSFKKNHLLRKNNSLIGVKSAFLKAASELSIKFPDAYRIAQDFFDEMKKESILK